MGRLPHSVLLQLIRLATSFNKRPLPTNVDTPLEKRRGRSNFCGIATGPQAGDSHGGDCCGRLRLFMAPYSGGCIYEIRT